MRLASAQGLKQEVMAQVVAPFSARVARLQRRGAAAVTAAAVAAGDDAQDFVFGIGAQPSGKLPELQRSLALGVTRRGGQYRLAVRLQRASLADSALLRRITAHARGEVDVRFIGRIDKRATPWYQARTRPLLIGASTEHVDVTAGTIGGFVTRGGATYLLSNNHVLANEGQATAKDWILQPGAYDDGTEPTARAARLRYWIKLTTKGTNVVDAALAAVEKTVTFDAARLRGISSGKDKTLAGLGPAFVDEGETVLKIGRTTGATKGRVTAFDVDNVIVSYDIGNLRFDNQIEIEGTGRTAFSDGGDSGSLIVNAGMEAVALLFAGGETGGANGRGLTYANPLHRVLADLKATLLT